MGILEPYLRPYRVRSGFINFIPSESGSEDGSIFHYKCLGLIQGVPPFGSVYNPTEDKNSHISVLAYLAGETAAVLSQLLSLSSMLKL